jgi:iron complex transport system substrate-binding protein
MTINENVAAAFRRSNWSGITALQFHHVYRVNSNVVGHPGVRLVEGLQCLAQMLHSDKFTTPLPDYCSATV